MTTTNLECDSAQPYIKCASNDQMRSLIDPISSQFDRLLKSYVNFSLLFLALGCAEFLLLLVFFTFLSQSALLAFCLALVFLSFFSYFILRLYFQTQKPEKLRELRDRYIQGSKGLINYQEGDVEKHIMLANACCKLANSFHGKEYGMFQLPNWAQKQFPYLFSLTDKFNCWWLWQDVQKMKELMLIAAVDEHIKLVKCQPASLQAHAALANAYVMLSGLYADPRKLDDYDEDKWLPAERFSSAMEEKFRSTAERAIEEFKIISAYAPNDPWVHKQLAYSYHDLHMPLEEIKEYETILAITPDDKDTLYKLGILYFQQGRNAQGLRIYEELKRCLPKKADNLISFYGAYKPYNQFE